MKNQFIELPVTKIYISLRKLVYGAGVNDANYYTSRKIKGKKVDCPIYSIWRGMLSRCYCLATIKRQPSYGGCLVSSDWLVFSNFKRWVIKQDWIGKSLDKDIINPGNKVYSSENCAFVSADINNLLLDRRAKRGKLPQGVTKSGKKYRARISEYKNTIEIGSYETTSKASHAYSVEKYRILIEASERQEDNRVKEGLILHAELILDCKY